MFQSFSKTLIEVYIREERTSLKYTLLYYNLITFIVVGLHACHVDHVRLLHVIYTSVFSSGLTVLTFFSFIHNFAPQIYLGPSIYLVTIVGKQAVISLLLQPSVSLFKRSLKSSYLESLYRQLIYPPQSPVSLQAHEVLHSRHKQVLYRCRHTKALRCRHCESPIIVQAPHTKSYTLGTSKPCIVAGT